MERITADYDILVVELTMVEAAHPPSVTDTGTQRRTKDVGGAEWLQRSEPLGSDRIYIPRPSETVFILHENFLLGLMNY